MSNSLTLSIDPSFLINLVGTMLAAFFIMSFIMLIGWFWTRKRKVVKLNCLYTQVPLHPMYDISYDSLAKVHYFLEEYPGYENRQLRFSRAMVCRDTGKIFPECISWSGKARLEWDFLKKKHPGTYISWGSLSDEQKRSFEEDHDSLEGFQTGFSCNEPLPKNITTDYAFAKPGPLYVDLETRVLIGWKYVPETELEVLIVQKPRPSALELDTSAYQKEDTYD